MREPPVAQNSDERDPASERVAPVVHGVREQDRTTFFVRDALRDAIEPLFRQDADRCEPRCVRV